MIGNSDTGDTCRRFCKVIQRMSYNDPSDNASNSSTRFVIDQNSHNWLPTLPIRPLLPPKAVATPMKRNARKSGVIPSAAVISGGRFELYSQNTQSTVSRRKSWSREKVKRHHCTLRHFRVDQYSTTDTDGTIPYLI